jgi:hypothetical protein
MTLWQYASLLPAALDDPTGPPPRQAAKARRAKDANELEVYRYGLGASGRAQIDQYDSQAAGDASRTALEIETDLLDYGLSRVGGSAAKAELVARHVNRLSTINDRRITRRFGG